MAEQAGHRSRESLNALLRIFIKTLTAMAAVFALARIISPDLMNIKNDLAFWAGLACWPLAMVVGVAAAVWIARDLRSLGRPQLPATRLPERD